ncbi:MAG: methyltransferase domain-containing protein [Myxococcales bacterium]|nr:methyltransferase domain-containing protein [Myxococcales bacterium]
MYEHFARVYDNEYSLAYADETVERAEALFDEFGVSPGRMLDLACGTGTFALEMASRWWEVVGVDLSPQMLAIARDKAARAGLAHRARWIEADMRDVKIEGDVDVAVCWYDSLNHLLSVEDLGVTFERVAAVLKPGGLFVFDVNTLLMFEAIWSGSNHFLDMAETAVGWELDYDPDTGRGHARIAAFYREEDGRWRREDDEVWERAFADGEIRAALDAAGFDLLRRESFNPVRSESPEPLKDLYIARRR